MPRSWHKCWDFSNLWLGWVERGGELKETTPKIQKAKKDYYEAHYDPEKKAFPKDGVVSWGPGLALERVGPEKIP